MLKNILPALIVTALLGLYLANCFTPLRLTNDTVRYINIKEWLEAGKPAGHGAANEFLPYGYVWFLVLLEKLHLAKSFFIAFIQLLYFIGSVWFIKKLFGATLQWWQLAALCLLSWACLKFVITPLSEMQFLFFSMGALYFFHGWLHRGKKFQFLLWAIIFVAVAMLTRTIGVLLVAAFVISFLLKHRATIKSVIVTNKLLAAGLLIVLMVLFFVYDQFGITAYLRSHGNYFAAFREYPFGYVKNNFENHLVNWSALVLNAPAPRVSFINASLLKIVYVFGGILSIAGLMYFLSRKKASIPLEVKVYLACYAIVVFNWPLFEPRLWLPVFPLCIAVMLAQGKTLGRFGHYLVRTYQVMYILIGLVALGYYTYTSFNKKALATKQDAAIWRNEYETHFFGKPLSDTATVVRQPVVNILKKYD